MSDIDFGQISEVLNNKTDRDLRNVDTTAKADAVIDWQAPTAENDYTWYRKYASGWVEQGINYINNTSTRTFNLPLEMKDADYLVVLNAYANMSSHILYITSRTTTSISIYHGESNGVPFSWYVCGYAAA